MSKTQKKPSNLSMGGILPRKSQPLRPISKVRLPLPDKPKLAASPKKPVKALKSATKPKFARKPSFPKLIKLFQAAKYNWLYLVVPAYILFIYLFDIADKPPALNPDNSIASQYDSISKIDSVDFLPVKIALVLLSKIHIADHLELRLLSVAIALFSVFCFYKLIGLWASKRMAVIGVVLYASSSWLLFQGRQDNIYTMLVAAIPAILYIGTRFIKSGSSWKRVAYSLILVQFIFVPGGIWLLLLSSLGALFYYRQDTLNKSMILPAIVGVSTLASYAALIFYLSLDYYTQTLKLIGFEAGILPSLDTLANNITELPGQLFYRGIDDGSMWLVGTPILDWVTTIFLVAGFVYLIKTRIHPLRKKVLLVLMILSLLLITINGASYISLLLPALYLTVIIGVTYMIEQWLIIFPNNPLARWLGISLVCVAIAMAAGYNIERYFIGWPKSEAYHQTFIE